MLILTSLHAINNAHSVKIKDVPTVNRGACKTALLCEITGDMSCKALAQNKEVLQVPAPIFFLLEVTRLRYEAEGKQTERPKLKPFELSPSCHLPF